MERAKQLSFVDLIFRYSLVSPLGAAYVFEAERCILSKEGVSVLSLCEMRRLLTVEDESSMPYVSSRDEVESGFVARDEKYDISYGAKKLPLGCIWVAVLRNYL